MRPDRVRGLLKPEYLLRPMQLLRRLAVSLRPPRGPVLARLPWRLDLLVRLDDDMGRALLHLGVYDLPVTETLWRLTELGDLGVDAGANIGYTASLLAVRAGRAGLVVAFEPHPVLRAELAANIARWAGCAVAPVDVRGYALSAAPGALALVEGDAFAANRGMASVRSWDHAPPEALRVQAETLDRVFGPGVRVGVLKVDVEGHERAVLAGAARLLAERRVRDVVYEDHEGYPSEVSRLLEAAGFTVFALGRRLAGPELKPPARWLPTSWLPPNFLATTDPDRARTRMAPRGWRSLRG